MPTLSVCLIVKNEEEVLARCLTCAEDIADELIVVDTGSNDATREIACGFTPLVYDFPWCDDFAAARNFSFSKATMDYILWLDADDVIDRANRAKLKSLKETLSPDTDMVFLRYDMGFDAHGKPALSFYRERIVRRRAGFSWVGAVHEVMIPSGNLRYEDISIEHRKLRAAEPGRNLRIYQKLLAAGRALDARHQYYYARELLDTGEYGQAAAHFRECLAMNGAKEDKIGACLALSRCLDHLDDPLGALDALLFSFRYGAPRAEALCGIGARCMQEGRYQDAIYWYAQALSKKTDLKDGGFCLADYHDFLPHIQLCVCYDRLGDRQSAIFHNEKAGALKPDDPAYLHNKAYFERVKTLDAT